MRKESPKAQIIGGKATYVIANALRSRRATVPPRIPVRAQEPHCVNGSHHRHYSNQSPHSRRSLFNFVGSMRAQQSPAERVAEIQAALRFLNAE